MLESNITQRVLPIKPIQGLPTKLVYFIRRGILRIAKVIQLGIVALLSSLVLLADSAEFEFFSQKVELSHHSNKFHKLPMQYSEEALLEVYSHFDGDSLSLVIERLHMYREKFRLNDWLYFLLLRQSSEALYPNASDDYRLLFCWYMLLQDGVKSRLHYLQQHLRLSVYSETEVHSLPSFAEGDGWWVDISDDSSEVFDQVTALRRLDDPRKKEGKSFNFVLDEVPQFNRKQVERKKLRFEHQMQDQTVNYLIEAVVDKNLIHVMYRYPDLSLGKHPTVPLSATARESLIPALQRMTKKMTQEQAVYLLLSFTRTAFQYDNDKDLYQGNVTFCPEETLYYSSSDCEDRSILFQYLLQELLGINSILLRYDDHVTVAAQLNQIYGMPIFYAGEPYSICDPTGPDSSIRIGELPGYVIAEHYEILGH